MAKKVAKKKVNKRASRKKVANKPAAKNKTVDRFVVSTVQLGNVLGVPERTIRDWSAKTDIPKDGRNQWDLCKVVPWFVERLNKEFIDKQPKSDDERRKLKAEADKMEHDAEIRRMKKEEMEGVLVPAGRLKARLVEVALLQRRAAQDLLEKLGPKERKEMVDMFDRTDNAFQEL